MQKLMTKLKMELESCWWLWIPEVWDPDGKEEAQEEIKKSRFPDQKWLNGQQGVLKTERSLILVALQTSA